MDRLHARNCDLEWLEKDREERRKHGGERERERSGNPKLSVFG